MDMIHELTLTTLTYGGDALGRLEDGRAVFVPFGLPGERVRVRILEEKRGHVRARLEEVLEASPRRIQPKCGHFGVCGGCHYQHLSYASQLEAKAGILRDQLSRLGRIEVPPVGPAVASPEPWNYRNHVQFHLAEDGRLGYVAHGEARQGSASIIPISECHLPEPALNELWPQLQFEPGSGIERASLRSGNELMLVLESGSPEPPEIEVEAGISVVHLFDDHPVVVAGSGRMSISVSGREFQVSSASFFQVNTSVAERMVGYVLERLPASVGTILDLYCGVGLFSAFLAPRCRRLIGVESSASACEDFAINLDEFDSVELYEGTAGAVLPYLDAAPDAVLVDPPRAGLGREVLDALAAMRPPRLIYVSCDPSTLARDARRLIDAGYKLEEVTPFDLFPQTYHIESISVFTADETEEMIKGG